MGKLFLRPLSNTDRKWVSQRIIESWGSEIVVAHGKIYHPAELSGFVVLNNEKIDGLLTFHIEGSSCEIVTLNSWNEGQGVGTALIEAVKVSASQECCDRLWLITTNDNTHALRFYQKRGFSFVTIRINAMEQARKIKPEIPTTGEDEIPIRDELELEMRI
jgi:ribosomal protein S18 acetylase RimI-like enzyme